jgi:thiosulfate/3-mercaptopyruvate sulfurtransferase
VKSTSSGAFIPAIRRRAHFAALGADGSQPACVHCGDGNAASLELAAMYAAGLEAPLYVGSWSAWTGDPGRPVAQGPEQG